MNAQNLAPIIDEMKSIQEWPEVEVNIPLMLFDIFDALALPPETFTDLMGEDAVQYLNEQGLAL